MKQLLRRVAAARWRLAMGRTLQAAVWTMAVGASIAAALVWVRLAWAPWPLAAGAVAALVAGLASLPSRRTAAIALDKANDLEERVMTALSLGGRASADGTVTQAVFDDAIESAKGADPSRVPLGRPRGLAWFAAAPVILLVGLLIPRVSASPAILGEAAPQAFVPAAVRKTEATKMSRRAFDLEKKAEQLQSPKMRELAQEMKHAAEQLKKNEVEQSKALAKLSELEQKAKDRRDEIAKQAGLTERNPLKGGGGDNAMSSQERNDLKQKLGEAMQKMAEAKAEMAKGGPESKQKFEKAMKDAAEKLKHRGDEKSKELARKMEELAEQADELSKEDLSKALDGLEDLSEQLGDALDEMDALESELEAMRAMKGELAEKSGKCRFCGKMGEDQDGDGMCGD